MRRIGRLHLAFLIASSLFIGQAAASDRTRDVSQLFYKANAFYERGDYAKAIENYIGILDLGLESGNIYYNIGNGFLKLGKIGYAILCYEKARALIPGDSDLKANLNYAKSLTEDSDLQTQPQYIIIKMIEIPFRSYSLKTIAVLGAILYVIVVLIASIFVMNPIFARKSRIFFMTALALFLLDLAAFAIRYHDEEMLKYGIAVQKDVECKYEPIDKSTTYYKLREGNKVVVLETRNGWRQIKRLDGKIAWVKKEAVEEI